MITRRILIMSGNIKEVYSSTEALAALIEATKAHQKEYDLTLMNAFEQKLYSNYNFAKIWYEEQRAGEKYYTWEQYKSSFTTILWVIVIRSRQP